MKLVISIVFCFFARVSTEKGHFYFETDTRIVLVSGENPEDGQLRLFRSAIERHFSPVMLRIKNEINQIKEIQNYLNSLSFQDNEISVITSSSNYFATNDPSNLAINVAKVALVRGGSVVMAYPMVKNLSSFSTPFDDLASKVKEKLSELSNPLKNDFHPAPVDLEEWKVSIKILSKYKRLLVKQHQYQLNNASVYDERYCAFAGVTKALKHFFKTLEKNIDSFSLGSLKNLCQTLAQNETLSYILGVVKDYDSLVFKRIDSKIEDVLLVKDPKSKRLANHLHSKSYTYTAFTFAEDGQLPFMVANFGSGDVLTPERKNDESYLDRIIPNIAEYLNGEENFPTVHVIAVITNEKFENLVDFVKNILTLSYPKKKIYFSIVLQGDKTGNHSKEVQKMLQMQEMKEFKSVRTFLTGENYYDAYQKAWKLAKMINDSDYIFFIHSSVRFRIKNIVEELLRLNRRVVGPLLESKEGGVFNFKSDQEGRELKDNILAAPFADRYEDFEHQNISLIGLLQIPYMFGTILMKIDVVERLDISFNLCSSSCEKTDIKCLQRDETSFCESNHYDNLYYPDLEAWGVLCKNINDNGFILYLSNYEKYGYYDLKNIEENQNNETESIKIEEDLKENIDKNK